MNTLTSILILALLISLIWAGNQLNNWCDKNSNI